VTPAIALRRFYRRSAEFNRIHLIGALTAVRYWPRAKQLSTWELLLDSTRHGSEINGFAVLVDILLKILRSAIRQFDSGEFVDRLTVEFSFLKKRPKFGATFISGLP